MRRVRSLLVHRNTTLLPIRDMDASLERLQAKIAKQIEQREASIQPLRDYALRAAVSSDVSADDLALIALEQELAAWKRMAARLAQTVLFEPREHRALRLPPQR
jgi:hypothetical protein